MFNLSFDSRVNEAMKAGSPRWGNMRGNASPRSSLKRHYNLSVCPWRVLLILRQTWRAISACHLVLKVLASSCLSFQSQQWELKSWSDFFSQFRTLTQYWTSIQLYYLWHQNCVILFIQLLEWRMSKGPCVLHFWDEIDFIKFCNFKT
jgi:hypothetical protein